MKIKQAIAVAAVILSMTGTSTVLGVEKDERWVCEHIKEAASEMYVIATEDSVKQSELKNLVYGTYQDTPAARGIVEDLYEKKGLLTEEQFSNRWHTKCQQTLAVEKARSPRTATVPDADQLKEGEAAILSGCKWQSELAESIMRTRQSGASLPDTMDSQMGTEPEKYFARTLVIKAYELKRGSDKAMREQAIADFRDGEYLSCYNLLMGN